MTKFINALVLSLVGVMPPQLASAQSRDADVGLRGQVFGVYVYNRFLLGGAGVEWGTYGDSNHFYAAVTKEGAGIALAKTLRFCANPVPCGGPHYGAGVFVFNGRVAPTVITGIDVELPFTHNGPMLRAGAKAFLPSFYTIGTAGISFPLRRRQPE